MKLFHVQRDFFVRHRKSRHGDFIIFCSNSNGQNVMLTDATA